jgi:hypothetical protein
MSTQTELADTTANRIEEAIDIARGHLEEAREDAPDTLEDDIADLVFELDDIDNAVDDAQDGEGANPLGIVPAKLDYVQAIADNLTDQADIDALDDVEDDLEAVEEHLEDVDITQSKWFVTVNGIPALFDEQEVSPNALKKKGNVDGNPNDYSLHILPTPTAGNDESDIKIPADDHDPVDLAEHDYFSTEKEQGGVV